MGSLLNITKKLLLTRSDLEDLAKQLTQAPKNRINSNRSNGRRLKDSTIAAKRRRGSTTPSTKLRDTGELSNDITYEVKSDSIKVGNTSKKHSLTKRITKRRWKKGRKGNRIKFSDLGRIHNEGLGNPRRTYLFPKRNKIFKEEETIILNYINNRIKRILG